MKTNIIAYRRVSTREQEESGLGLDAQNFVLTRYAQLINGTVLRTYDETDSGGKNSREELSKALAHAKRSRAVLAVSVLDRLSRNSLLINQLLESGVDFVDASSPNDTPLVTRIKAAVAQDELEKISQRTKAALAALKRRGVKLGTNNLTEEGRKRGAINAGKALARAADEAYADILPLMLEWRRLGATQQQIADRLNQDGQTTRKGKPWSQPGVRRTLLRAKIIM